MADTNHPSRVHDRETRTASRELRLEQQRRRLEEEDRRKAESEANRQMWDALRQAAGRKESGDVDPVWVMENLSVRISEIDAEKIPNLASLEYLGQVRLNHDARRDFNREVVRRILARMTAAEKEGDKRGRVSAEGTGSQMLREYLKEMGHEQHVSAGDSQDGA